jgi:hypothetical protein
MQSVYMATQLKNENVECSQDGLEIVHNKCRVRSKSGMRWMDGSGKYNEIEVS